MLMKFNERLMILRNQNNDSKYFEIFKKTYLCAFYFITPYH